MMVKLLNILTVFFPPKTLIRLLLAMRCCVIGLNWMECAIVGRALEKHSFDHIVISGYSMLQSGYFVSELSQWNFMARAKLYSDMEVMLANKLGWRKFTPLERSLLAFPLSERIAIGSLTIKVFIVPQSFWVSLSA